MTYVEKMANKIRAHIFEGINENIPDIINQIIADTKRASKQEIDKQIAKLDPKAVVYLAGLFDANYIIDQAEVKEQEK